TLDAANDQAFLRVSGGKVEVDDEATFAAPQVAGSPFAGVTRIVVQDAATNTNQGVTFTGSETFVLPGGLQSSGVESVKFAKDINPSAGTVDVNAPVTIVLTGATLTTSSGNITLQANQGVAASGNFVGIDILSGSHVTSATGNILLRGTGGDSG